MQPKKLSSLLNAALGLTLGVLPLTVCAAALSNGQILTINSAITTFNASSTPVVTGGSWFAMDFNFNSTIGAFEKGGLASGANGIVVGAITTAGVFHPGFLSDSDTGQLVKSWGYFAATGTNFNTVAITGDTLAGVVMSGWNAAWKTDAVMQLGTGAWTPLNVAAIGLPAGPYTNGVGKLGWTGTCGDPYTLDYAATVPAGDRSIFVSAEYFLHLQGYVIGGACSGVVTTWPVDGDTAVVAPITTGFSVSFNEAMNPASVTGAFLAVSGGVTVGTPTSADNKVFIFPLTGVAGSAIYSVTLNAAGVAAASGNVYIPATAYVRTFTTVPDVTPPTVVSTLPATGSTIDPGTGSVSITFSEPVARVTASAISINKGVTLGTPTGSNSNKTWRFPITSGKLAYITAYTLSFNAGVTDPTGNPLTLPANVSFTTFPDTTPPTVLVTTPATGATTAPNTSTVSVTFSEPVSNVMASAISISRGVTLGAPTGSNTNQTWTFPVTSGNLENLTGYTLSFNNGPLDLADNPLTLPAAVTFSTSAGPNPKLSAATQDKLLICPGSKFSMEVSPNHPIFTSIEQQTPLGIGLAQPGAGGGHRGAATGVEAAVIDKAWTFFGNAGIHFTQTAITDNGNGTLNFGGWRVAWNNMPSINMGSGQPATFVWDGVYGHSYTLAYRAVVPLDDPSGLGGVPYVLYLAGKVTGGLGQQSANCDVLPVAPSKLTLGVADGAITVNSQLRPDDASLIAAGYSIAGRPNNLDFNKYGLITYTVTGLTAGQTVAVTLTLPQAVPRGSHIYKVSRAGYIDITGQVKIAGATITLDIEDDGPLDDCNAGAVCAGVIVDPIVIGTPLAAGSSGDASGGGCAYRPAGQPDPTLPGLLLGGLGYLGWRRGQRV